MATVSVRRASQADSEAAAGVQLASWRRTYADVLPENHLDDVEPGELAERWAEAVQAPPSGRHLVLVALDGADLVGIASLAPAEDPDLDERRTAELQVLAVDPERTRSGHGSRLVAAAVDMVREQGTLLLVAWLSTADAAGESLLTAAGWSRDGATRTLDLLADGSCLVVQHRLHTSLPDVA